MAPLLATTAVQLLDPEAVLVDHRIVVALQPCGDQRGTHLGCVGDAQLYRSAAPRRKQLSTLRVEDHTGDNGTAGLAHGDRHPPIGFGF